MEDEPVGTNDDVDADNQAAIPDDDAPVGVAITDGGTTVTLSYIVETEAHDPANPPGSATEANLVPNGYTSADSGELSVTFTGVKLQTAGTSDVAPLFDPGTPVLRDPGATTDSTIKVRPDPGGRPSTAIKVGVGAAAATAVALLFLLGGGDDDDATVERPPTSVTTVAADAAEPATPAVAAAPVAQLERFTATFDQATYTTTYDATFSMDARELDISWELQAHEDCGVFDSFDGRATWTHPHESQRGQVPGFPDDRYCQDPLGTAGHAGEVLVRFPSGERSCQYAYPGGSAEGVIEEPDVTCG